LEIGQGKSGKSLVKISGNPDKPIKGHSEIPNTHTLTWGAVPPRPFGNKHISAIQIYEKNLIDFGENVGTRRNHFVPLFLK